MFGRLFTVAIFTAVLAMPVAGQNPQLQGQKQQRKQLKGDRKKGGNEALKFQKRLNLTEEQTNQVRALLAERDRAGGLKGKDAKAARQQFMTSLRGILTPQQLEKLDQRRQGKRK